jgi:hypothetical protein
VQREHSNASCADRGRRIRLEHSCVSPSRGDSRDDGRCGRADCRGELGTILGDRVDGADRERRTNPERRAHGVGIVGRSHGSPNLGTDGGAIRRSHGGADSDAGAASHADAGPDPRRPAAARRGAFLRVSVTRVEHAREPAHRHQLDAVSRSGEREAAEG